VIRLVLIVAIVVGFVMVLMGVIFDDPADAKAIAPVEQKRLCVDETGAPCWNPVNAYKAGVLGHTGNIPDKYHDAIKKAVRAEGDNFEQRVIDNIPWYSKASWKIACLETAGYRAMNKAIYFHCLDQDQMDKFLGDLGHVYLKCGVGTLVIAGTLVAADPGDGTLKAVAALGGGIGCAAAESIDLLEWGWSQQDWHLAQGPDSAAVGGGASW